MSHLPRAERSHGVAVLRAVGLGITLGVGAFAVLGLWVLLVGAEKAYEHLAQEKS